tara:strand:+ start:105 stop:923 length:819 start_codon:yes stop_codon:yes gene_type:complete
LKKIYRIIAKKFSYLFFLVFSNILSIFGFKIIPSYNDITKYNFIYSKKSRRLVYEPTKDRFSKIIIDTSHYSSKLCKLGAKFGTNKSGLNMLGHRSGYTPYYDLLFRHLKKEKINFAEIGIESNASTKMWRKYFSKAKIYGLEFEDIKIERAKKHKLKNTFYEKIDVNSQISINKAFSNINKKFDIIIDDSTHYFDHQINIIKTVNPFLKKNGILIIEDIFKNRKEHSEKIYYEKLKNLKKFFKKIYFVEFHNINNWTASWKCEKILVLIKN